MTSTSRALLALSLALLSVVAIAPGARAADLLSTEVTADEAALRACHMRLAPGGAGVVQKSLTSDSSGLISARLDAAGGNWDVGVFDAASGRSVAWTAARAAYRPPDR